MEGGTSLEAQNQELQRRATFFSGYELFRGWPWRELNALSNAVIKKSFPQNKVIIREGDIADGMFFIASGFVKVVRRVRSERLSNKFPWLTLLLFQTYSIEVFFYP